MSIMKKAACICVTTALVAGPFAAFMTSYFIAGSYAATVTLYVTCGVYTAFFLGICLCRYWPESQLLPTAPVVLAPPIVHVENMAVLPPVEQSQTGSSHTIAPDLKSVALSSVSSDDPNRIEDMDISLGVSCA